MMRLMNDNGNGTEAQETAQQNQDPFVEVGVRIFQSGKIMVQGPDDKAATIQILSRAIAFMSTKVENKQESAILKPKGLAGMDAALRRMPTKSGFNH